MTDDMPIRILIGGMLVLGPIACGDPDLPDEPTYRSPGGCISFDHALCAEGRGPLVYRDGDPLHDMCGVLGVDYDPMLRLPARDGSFEGAARYTATYDDIGRVTAIEADCGRDEPWLATLEWGDDGRLMRYYADGDDDTDIETVPVYVDGRLAAHQTTFHDAGGGTRQPPRVDYLMDDMGRLAVLDTENPYIGHVHREFVYDADRLESMVWDSLDLEGNPATYTTSYEYDEDGRLTRVNMPDASYDRVVDFVWTSATQGRVEGEDYVIWFEIDEEGRLVRTEFDLSFHGVQTWEWDADGRLVEFWMRGA